MAQMMSTEGEGDNTEVHGDVCAPCEEADEQVDEFLSGSDAHLYSQAVEHGKEQAEQMIDHLWTFTATCTTRHNSTSLSSSLIHT